MARLAGPCVHGDGVRLYNDTRSRRGLMLGYDWSDFGKRIAYDTKVNFSNYDMTRIILSKHDCCSKIAPTSLAS